jgi:group I intron endonuclease
MEKIKCLENLNLQFMALSAIIKHVLKIKVFKMSTCGIYKLVFKGTTALYVGKSLNIEKRFGGHISDMRCGRSSKKLLNAYSLYGLPTLEILEVCVEKYLSVREDYWITTLDTVVNGFNTVYETHHNNNSSLCGELCSNANHSTEEYVEIAKMLAKGFTYLEIEECLGTSRGVVQTISSLKQHTWLKLVVPAVYKIIEDNNRLYKEKGACLEYRTGKILSIVSPQGTLFEVSSIAAFSREHNLESTCISRVL